jgi:N-methylhydantoinase B
MAGGLGARTDKDGVDTGGLHLIPMGLIPDVEMQEYTYPIIYLWRREERDSGGPGKYRGGLSPSDCIICYGNEIPSQLITGGSGKAISMNIGLCGGYPGNTALDILLCKTDVRELLKQGIIPSSLKEIQSEKVEILQPMAMSYLGPKDVYYFNWQGGAGYMDPLLRDPTLVLNDLREKKISTETARTIYGVVVNPGTMEINENETRQTRSKIIEERKRKAKRPDLTSQSSNYHIEVKTEALSQDIDENVKVTEEDGKRVLKCAHCGYRIADGDENYPDHLLFYEGHVSEAGPQIHPHPEHYVDAKVVFRQYYCPGCYIAFITQVVPVS